MNNKKTVWTLYSILVYDYQRQIKRC